MHMVMKYAPALLYLKFFNLFGFLPGNAILITHQYIIIQRTKINRNFAFYNPL